MQGPTATAAPTARPQHHDIFLEPLYTVELPPFSEDDIDGEGEVVFDRAPARRRTPTARRG
ncbi:hypothetical protein [Streptomyces sp. NPDC051569]|uniref:hypothetical protein n=1 Tax=Streptomyces sp. NPDC051569 TaxID=3365661 RepID=UPI003790DC20